MMILIGNTGFLRIFDLFYNKFKIFYYCQYNPFKPSYFRKKINYNRIILCELCTSIAKYLQ